MEQAETLTWLKILAVLFLSTQPVHLNPHSTRACESIRELCIVEMVVKKLSNKKLRESGFKTHPSVGSTKTLNVC